MLKSLVIALTTSYVAWFIQRHEYQVVYPFDATYTAPAQTGETRLTEVKHRTQDGETLILWVARASPGRPTLLYLPGNAGTLAGRAARFSALIDRGFGVVALAYRGSSGSSGRPDEDRLTGDGMEVAQAARAFLGDKHPGPLVLYGESLGSALAIKIAGAGLGDAVVLQSPFTSIRDLVQTQFPDEDLGRLFTQVWDSRTGIGTVTQPLLILHGTADKLVPIAQGEELYARAGSRTKRFVALDGQGHTGVWGVEAQRALYDFLDGL